MDSAALVLAETSCSPPQPPSGTPAPPHSSLPFRHQPHRAGRSSLRAPNPHHRQGTMFQAYFMLKSVCSAISVAAFAYLHPWKKASTIEGYQIGFLIAALGCDLSNLLVFTPMSIKMMVKRYKMEKDLGIGTEVGYSKSVELAKTNPALATMIRKFGMIHGLSTLASAMSLGSLVIHSWYLSSKLDL